MNSITKNSLKNLYSLNSKDTVDSMDGERLINASDRMHSLNFELQLNKALSQQGIFGPVKVLLSFKMFGLAVLVLAVLTSAIGVVYMKHLDRSLHIQLEKLQKARDVLHVEWSKLLLEQSTLSSDVRVEQLARENLKMRLPTPAETMVTRP